MTVPPFALLFLALPILLVGEQLVRRIRWLDRLNIPAPIIGGLLAAIAILIVQRVSPGSITLFDKTTNRFWLWPILPQWRLSATAPATAVSQPLLILFFTCIGLNASAVLARRGGVPLLIFLALATLFAAIQDIVGVITAKVVGVDPLMGILCSGVTLMGGFGTAASWSPSFEANGLPNATTIGIAAAAFGVIAGGLLAGPLAGRLIERKLRLNAVEESPAGAIDVPIRGGFLSDFIELARSPAKTLVHLFVLLVCLKLGAFLSAAVGGVRIGQQKLTFPVYMGSLIVAAVVRNLHDLVGGKFIETRHVDRIASFVLAWMLTVIMIGLKLDQLATLALPMLIILVVQVVIMLALAYWIVFRVMGRDYEAATMSAGMIGFGIGQTSNAVASMRELARHFGPEPRAFLIVTIVGGFLIDFTNAFLIMGFLNVFKH